MKIHDERIERLALTLLQGLMLRRKEDGYTDRSAIAEAFHLADEYYMAEENYTALKCQKNCTSYNDQTHCDYCLRAKGNNKMDDYYLKE